MEALGPVLLLFSIPMILRWIPQNRFVGFRPPAALRDKSIWYDANALAGRHCFVLGLVLVALEFTLPVTALAAMRNEILWTVSTVGLVTIMVSDWRRANRWMRERHRSAWPPVPPWTQPR